MKLTEREKKMATALAILLCIAIGYYAVYSPLSSLYSGLKNTALNMQGQSEKLESIHEELQQVRNQKQQFESILGDKNDNISSLLQQIADANNLRSNIAGITTGSKSNVQNKLVKITTDFKLEGAPIQAIIKTVYDIENNDKLIIIESLKISKGLKGTDMYDASIRLNTFMAE